MRGESGGQQLQVRNGVAFVKQMALDEPDGPETSPPRPTDLTPRPPLQLRGYAARGEGEPE